MASDELRSAGAGVVRWLAAATVIFFVGLVGFMAAFIDVSAGEILSLRITVVALLFFLGSAVVGLLLPRRWYLATLTAWGPLLVGGVSLYVKLTNDEVRVSTKLLLASLVVIPVLALLCGLAGRWFILRRRSLESMVG